MHPRTPAPTPRPDEAPPRVQGLQSSVGGGNVQHNHYYGSPPRPRLVTRFRIEKVGVFAFAIVAVVLVRAPIPVPTRTLWWWAWNGCAVMSLGMAVTIAVVSSRRRDTVTGWSLAVAGAVVLLAVAGVTSAPWWPAQGRPGCGAAQIAVDPQFRPLVSAALETYRTGPATGADADQGDRGDCAGALTIEETGDDLHDRLLTAGTPVAAVVTADPSSLRGLGGSWTNLGVVPDRRTKWYTIGLDRAAVYLRDSEHRRPRGVQLAELRDLGVGRFTPYEPIGLAVLSAAGSDWVPGFDRPAADPAGRPCPAHVVIPSRWAASCTAPAALRPATVLDVEGNTVGAPVLGVYLSVPDGDAEAAGDASAPTAGARAAARRFLAWLDAGPERLGLQRLSEPVTRVLAPLDEQVRLLRAENQVPPVHVIVVVDASLSMDRATDARRFGAIAPWRPAIDGVRRWAGRSRPARADRVSIVVAQSGRRGARVRPLDPIGRRLAAGWAGTLPRGETALPQALERAHRLEREHARAGRRSIVVLVTDGVNAFTERRLPSSISGLHTLVVRDGNGCDAVPARARTRCGGAQLDENDVADRLGDLVDERREGRR